MTYKAVTAKPIGDRVMQTFWLTLADAKSWSEETAKKHDCSVVIYEIVSAYLETILPPEISLEKEKEVTK